MLTKTKDISLLTPSEYVAAKGLPKKNLTRREKSVSALVSEGKTAKQIARVLGISPRTVEWHRNAVYRKLGVSSKWGLMWVMLAKDRKAENV